MAQQRARTNASEGTNASEWDSIARKAKTPAIAGGAAVTGLIGGIALSRRAPGKKILGVRLGAGTARGSVREPGECCQGNRRVRRARRRPRERDPGGPRGRC